MKNISTFGQTLSGRNPSTSAILSLDLYCTYYKRQDTGATVIVHKMIKNSKHNNAKKRSHCGKIQRVFCDAGCSECRWSVWTWRVVCGTRCWLARLLQLRRVCLSTVRGDLLRFASFSHNTRQFRWQVKFAYLTVLIFWYGTGDRESALRVWHLFHQELVVCENGSSLI